MISFTIILFCFSVNILNEANARHFAETNRTIWGWQSPSYLNYTDTSFTDIQTSNMNSTLHDQGDTKPQPLELGLDTVWNGFIWMYRGFQFIVNILIMSTLNFHNFIHDFNTGVTIIPTYIANPIAIIVNACHLLAIIQFLSGRNMGEGL